MSRLASNRHCKKRTGDLAAAACKRAGAKKQARKGKKKKLRRGGASRSWCLAEGSKHIQAWPQFASADLVPSSAVIVGSAESKSASRESNDAPRRRRPAGDAQRASDEILLFLSDLGEEAAQGLFSGASRRHLGCEAID
jgi:hypothetical protein